MSKAEELVKVCELLTHWGCEESMARQAAVQIVSGHPCDINDVFLSDNLVVTSFVGEDAPELFYTKSIDGLIRHKGSIVDIRKLISSLPKHLGAEQTKSTSDEGLEDEPELMTTHASLTSQARSYPKYIVSVYEVTGCGMPPFELFRFGNGQVFDVTHSDSKKVVESLRNAIFTLEAMKKNIPSKEDEMDVLRLKTLQCQGDQET